MQITDSEATLEQLVRESLRLQRVLLARFESLETNMSALTESVEALKGAVDGVAQRLLPQVAALETALAAAQADDAAAASTLAEAATATAAIRTEVDRLNALGAEPSTPVDESAPDAGTTPELEAPPSEPAADLSELQS